MSENLIPSLGRRSYLVLIAACLLPLVVATVVTSSLVRQQRETLHRIEALAAEADLYDQMFLALRILVRQQAEPLSDTGSVTATATAKRAFRETATTVRSGAMQRVLPERREQVLTGLASVDAVAEQIASNELINEEKYMQPDLGRAMHDYLSMSMEQVLQSENPIIRALGMLDRRLGSRRLALVTVENEHPLVREFGAFRRRADAEWRARRVITKA